MQVWISRNRFTLGAGVALIIVLMLVLSQFGGGSQTTTTQQPASPSNPWFWLAALVLLAGAGASFANRGGAPARWALGILIIILGLKFISGIVFGEKAVEVEQNVRNDMANVVLGKTPTQKGDAPTATTNAQVAKHEAKWERRETDGSIPVGVWSQWIIVGDCNFALFLDEKHHARAKLTVGGVVDLIKDTHTKGVRELSVMTEIKGETGYPIKFTCP